MTDEQMIDLWNEKFYDLVACGASDEAATKAADALLRSAVNRNQVNRLLAKHGK